MQAMEELTAKLPKGFDYEWTGLSYRNARERSKPVCSMFSVIIVFLFWQLLHNIWSIPIAVVLILPQRHRRLHQHHLLRGLPTTSISRSACLIHLADQERYSYRAVRHEHRCRRREYD